MRKPVLPYANNKGADQPALPRSLISTFIVRCLDSIIPLISITKISSLYLASVAAQAGWSLTWSQIPKTGFLVTRLNLILIVSKAVLHLPSIIIFIVHSSVCPRPFDEPSQDIIVLFVLRKPILQTRMHSHPVGLDV